MPQPVLRLLHVNMKALKAIATLPPNPYIFHENV
jgi:hypothetical protein